MKHVGTLLVTMAFLSTVLADPTIGGKAENAANKTTDAVKKTVRDAQDKACEVVNGKVECVTKKAKHSVQNAADSAATKADEIKNEAKGKAEEIKQEVQKK